MTGMTPAEFKTAHDALGLSGEFIAGRIGVHPNMVGRYEHPDRKGEVLEGPTRVMRELLAAWESSVDTLAAQAKARGHIVRRIEIEEFYRDAPEMYGWGATAQGLVLAEVQRRLQLSIEYR